MVGDYFRVGQLIGQILFLIGVLYCGSEMDVVVDNVFEDLVFQQYCMVGVEKVGKQILCVFIGDGVFFIKGFEDSNIEIVIWKCWFWFWYVFVVGLDFVKGVEVFEVLVGELVQECQGVVVYGFDVELIGEVEDFDIG